jgi:perilipin-2
MHTIHHVGQISGKLQRRLTKRTLAEAKALKEHSAEAINVLIYVAELVRLSISFPPFGQKLVF